MSESTCTISAFPSEVLFLVRRGYILAANVFPSEFLGIIHKPVSSAWLSGQE